MASKVLSCQTQYCFVQLKLQVYTYWSCTDIRQVWRHKCYVSRSSEIEDVHCERRTSFYRCPYQTTTPSSCLYVGQRANYASRRSYPGDVLRRRGLKRRTTRRLKDASVPARSARRLTDSPIYFHSTATVRLCDASHERRRSASRTPTLEPKVWRRHVDKIPSPIPSVFSLQQKPTLAAKQRTKYLSSTYTWRWSHDC